MSVWVFVPYQLLLAAIDLVKIVTALFPALSQSWIFDFFTEDMYILGLNLDACEIDLWWLLCRKKRERAPHGALYFIEPDRKGSETKHGLLRAYHAQSVSLGVSDPDNDGYKAFYEKAVAEIGRRMAEERP